MSIASVTDLDLPLQSSFLESSEHDFDPDHYEFEFQTVFAQPKAQKLFLQFVEAEKNSEQTEFALLVQKLQAIPEDCVTEQRELAIHIFKSFIKEGCMRELNINRQLRQEVESALLSEENFKLPCKNIFQRVYDNIMLSLGFDVFPRFLRSTSFKHFLKCNPYILVKIGIHKSTIFYSKLQESDFKSKYVTAKDMQIAALLTKDYLHWSPLISTEEHQSYTSNLEVLAPDMITNHGYMQLSKLVYRMPCSAQIGIKLLHNSKFADCNVIRHEHIKYLPAQGELLATSINRSVLEGTFLVSERDFIFAASCVHDESKSQYLLVERSIINSDVPERKNCVRALAFAVTSIQHVSAFECRLVSVILANMKGWMEPKAKKVNSLSKIFLKKGHKTNLAGLQDLIDRYYLSGETQIEDSAKIYQTMLENKLTKLKNV